MKQCVTGSAFTLPSGCDTNLDGVGHNFTEGTIRRWLDARPSLGDAQRARLVASLYVNARLVPPCSAFVLARALNICLPPVRRTDGDLVALVAFAAIAKSALPRHLKESDADVLRLAFAIAAPDPVLDHHNTAGADEAAPLAVPAWILTALNRGRPSSKSGIRSRPAELRGVKK